MRISNKRKDTCSKKIILHQISKSQDIISPISRSSKREINKIGCRIEQYFLQKITRRKLILTKYVPRQIFRGYFVNGRRICQLKVTVSLLVSNLRACKTSFLAEHGELDTCIRPNPNFGDTKHKDGKQYRTNSKWDWIGESFGTSIRAPDPFEFKYYSI